MPFSDMELDRVIRYPVPTHTNIFLRSPRTMTVVNAMLLLDGGQKQGRREFKGL
jgi:hypothetical protein